LAWLSPAEGFNTFSDTHRTRKLLTGERASSIDARMIFQRPASQFFVNFSPQIQNCETTWFALLLLLLLLLDQRSVS